MKFEYNAVIKVSGVVEADSEYEAQQRINRIVADTMLCDTDEMEWDDTDVPYINEVEPE